MGRPKKIDNPRRPRGPFLMPGGAHSCRIVEIPTGPHAGNYAIIFETLKGGVSYHAGVYRRPTLETAFQFAESKGVPVHD
jgi:hypothetical protein